MWQKALCCKYQNCNKEFKTKKTLKYHVKIHRGEKDFTCTYNDCEKKFIQFSSFQKHLRTHTGDKPYKCNYEGCTQAFAQSSNLKRHEKTHTKDKPFQCDQCPKSFTTDQNMKQHMLIHENYQQRDKFKCDIDGCKKEYLYSCSLKKHQKHDHQIKINFMDQQQQQYNNIMQPQFQLPVTGSVFCDPISSSILSNFFNNQHLVINHDGHLDLLLNGYLYNFNKETGKIELHDLDDQKENKEEKKQEDEKKTKIGNFLINPDDRNTKKEKKFKPYKPKIESNQINEQNMKQEVAGFTSTKNREQPITQFKPEVRNLNQQANVTVINDVNSTKVACETSHVHSKQCGHIPIYHQGHIDYIVGNQLHHQQNEKCEYHGNISIANEVNKPIDKS